MIVFEIVSPDHHLALSTHYLQDFFGRFLSYLRFNTPPLDGDSSRQSVRQPGVSLLWTPKVGYLNFKSVLFKSILVGHFQSTSSPRLYPSGFQL